MIGRIKIMVILLSALLMSLVSGVQANSDVWEVIALEGNKEYYIGYTYDQCDIYIRWNGSVRIYVRDNEHNVQTITIEGGSLRKYTSDDQGIIHLGRSDMFYLKYREKAKRLPKEVRKLFLGYYGLN